MQSAIRQRSHGFTLIEVLVSVVIIAIGLLGIAKMEAVALSSTGVAQQRSIAAMEAASLAAAMHADREYWNSGAAPALTTISGTTITPTSLATAVNCISGATGSSAPCTPAKVAAFDLQRWANNVGGSPSYNNPGGLYAAPMTLAPALPTQVTTIACTTAVTTAISCTIQITWGETTVAANAQGSNASAASMASGASAGFNIPTYTLYVQP
jgi:type IV pilus assembly protein PilV